MYIHYCRTWKADYVENLLQCLEDSYETNKMFALNILLTCPQELLEVKKLKKKNIVNKKNNFWIQKIQQTPILNLARRIKEHSYNPCANFLYLCRVGELLRAWMWSPSWVKPPPWSPRIACLRHTSCACWWRAARSCCRETRKNITIASICRRYSISKYIFYGFDKFVQIMIFWNNLNEGTYITFKTV